MLACGGGSGPVVSLPTATSGSRLSSATSPYVRSHAVDLVDWYPWGDEAFDRARALDRPVLLLVGYATCHWCHVLAEESFADPEVADFLDERFVLVVVDREERPDLDQVYLEAVRRLTGGAGGWPLLVVLTPDRVPVAGLTYLPPRDGDRGVARGLTSVLGELSDQWGADRQALLDRGAALSRELADRAGPPPGLVRPLTDLERAAAERLMGMEDREHGGFGSRPKFPRPVSLDWALGRADTRPMALRALAAIDGGALHDPLSGGFHRYTVDAAWRVPHYEKMTTDNAQLARTFLAAWLATGEERHAQVARRTLGWLAAMSLPGGELASAVDADSRSAAGDLEEGAFYTWTADQVRGVLGAEADDAAAALGLGEEPGAPRRVGVVSPEVLARLVEARAARPAPAVDDKGVTAWQGLALSALARGGQLLGEPARVELAARVAEVTLAGLGPDGRPRRTLAEGAPPAVLDDPAFLAEGLLDLFQATAEPRWLEAAAAQLEVVDRWYGTSEGGFSRVPSDAPTMLFRPTADEDGSDPAAAAVAADAMVTLAALTGDDRWRRRAERAWNAAQGVTGGAPVTHLGWLGVARRLDEPPLELVVVWPEGADAAALRDATFRVDAPGAVRLGASTTRARELGSRVALLAERDGVQVPTAFVCRAGVCRQPATTVEGVQTAIREALER